MTMTRMTPAITLALFALALRASAATKYWNHGGANDRWSNPTNWYGNAVIPSNDTPSVQDGYLPVNAPQTILLDMDAFIGMFSCTATGNRHVTVNTDNGSTFTFSSANGIYGIRSVDLTLNPAIRLTAASMTIDRSDRNVTLNGDIGPAPGYAIPYLAPKNGGILTLSGSNNVSYIKSTGAGEVIIQHPHALGNGNIEIPDNGLLSITTNARLYGNLIGCSTNSAYSVNLRVTGAGTNDVTLIVDGNSTVGERILVQTNGGGSKARFFIKLRSASSYTPNWETQTNTTLIFENGTTCGDVTGKGAISGGGAFVLDCGTSTTRLFGACTFGGGTLLRSGVLYVQDHDRLPTNGTVTIESAATLFLYAKSQTVSNLTGNGSVNFSSISASGTNIVTGAFSPGLPVGTLTFTNPGHLILGPDCVSRFQLGSLAGTSDKVRLTTSYTRLTLGGRLVVENLGGLEAGSYTLFDMEGGSLAGSFTTVTMPDHFIGSIQTSSGDVVLSVQRVTGPGAVVWIK